MNRADDHEGRVIQLAEQQRVRASLTKMRLVNTDLYAPLDKAITETTEASAKVAAHLRTADDARLGEG